MGITTVMWWLVGYSLCFSGGADGIYGSGGQQLTLQVTPQGAGYAATFDLGLRA